MKRTIVLFGVLGVVGCFLPVIGNTSISLFDLRHHAVSPWLTLIAFAVPVIARRSQWLPIVGAVCFGYLGVRYGVRCLDLFLYAGIGGKLIAVAIAGGLIATIGALTGSRATDSSAKNVEESCSSRA